VNFGEYAAAGVDAGCCGTTGLGPIAAVTHPECTLARPAWADEDEAPGCRVSLAGPASGAIVRVEPVIDTDPPFAD
jgi:hypothetical protein